MNHHCSIRLWLITWTNLDQVPEPLMTFQWVSELTHWGLNKLADILQMTFSNTFSWMKVVEIELLLITYGPVDKSVLVQVMAWHQTVAKPKVKPMLTCDTIQHQLICYRILTHWGRDKMDAISQTTFSSAFSWMKIFEFWLIFHWSLFLRVQLTIFQHWFR